MMEVAVTTGAVRRAKLQSNHHHQQTNTQLFTGRIPLLSSKQQYEKLFLYILSCCLVYFGRVKGGCRALAPLLTIRQVMHQNTLTSVWSSRDELPVRRTGFRLSFNCPVPPEITPG